jgi:predicted HNH restriction endonuclease
MEVLQKIYHAIIDNSNHIINHAESWTRELAGAKNYVCTPDLQHWTFGKSVGADGTYHYNGGVAKRKLYSLGFVNVLELKEQKIKNKCINAFINWANKVNGYAIAEKFEKDQLNNKHFEILVHKDVIINWGAKAKGSIAIDSQKAFDDGFKNQIIKEVSFRNKQVVQLAKEKHGTICIVCQFDFGKVYGDHGAGFIEMHHLMPISLGARSTTVEDLRPVCANCHRMLHRGKKVLSIEELKVLIKR